jgi:hypothetical protein
MTRPQACLTQPPSKASLVYSHIIVYRLVMNVLYRGGYRRRFERVLEHVPAATRSLCDLCFGDTYVAEWCRARGITWTGIDLNRVFCERAVRRGFDAVCTDLLTADLPVADVYVMAGSLYHFHQTLPLLLDRILARTKRLILSEPVRNLSADRGLLGWFARRAADPGTGRAEFRFDAERLIAALRTEQERLGFKLSILSSDRDLVVEIVS